MVHAITDGVRLSALFPRARRLGSPDVRVTSCTADAHQVHPGDIYVALVRDTDDGHENVGEAVRRGASAVIGERPLPVGIPQYLVEDSREALGVLCQFLVARPTSRLTTVGVSGTHGKTTIAFLLNAILRAAKIPAGASHSLGWTNSYNTCPTAATTPQAPELAHRLAEMEAAGCVAGVVEVSSQALAERRVAGMTWDVAVLSNVRRAHLDRHGTVKNYRAAKLRLLDGLKNNGVAVINADDPATRHFRDQLPERTLWFGRDDSADVSATLIERLPSEQTFLLLAGNQTSAVRTRIIGDHHIANCLAAATAAMALGIELTDIVRGLESVERIPGRMERIECGQPFGVFIDRADCPDRLAIGLRTLRQAAMGRVICVYGPTSDGSREYRPLLGRVAERCSDISIITANDPGTDSVLRIAHDVLDGYSAPGRAHVIPDRTRAIQYALEIARPGDCLLIAGKGDADTQDLGDRILPWSDRAVAERFLYEVAADDGHAEDDGPVILPMWR